MTDHGPIKADKQIAAMLKTLSTWEHGLRGWDVFDYSVCLEPPFRRVLATPQRSVLVRDDAHISHGVPGGEGRIDHSRSTHQIGPDAPKKAPQAFYRRENPCEFQILLSEDMKFSPALTEQFFLSLSSCTTPISVEVLADHEQTIVQMACDPSFGPDLKNQLSAFFPGTFINEVRNALAAHTSGDTSTLIADFGLSSNFAQPLQTFRTFEPDPLTGLLGSLGNLQRGERAAFQVMFQRCRHSWHEEMQRVWSNPNIKESSLPNPFRTKEKLSVPLFAVAIRVAVNSPSERQSWQIIRHIGGTLSQFANPTGNELIALSNDDLPANNHLLSLINRTSYRTGMILNAAELSCIAHLPNVANSKLKRFKNDSKAAPEIAIGHEFILGENRHMNETKTVSLSVAQRTRHLHIIGGTGVGKSNLLLNLVKQDLEQQHGLCVIDPHGDLIDTVTENIPESRLNDVILFDPADSEHPIGFNILHAESELEKTLLASDLVATFRRFSTSWGDVMDSVLANGILAFVESTRGGTLFELKRFLVEKDFRNDFLQTVTDEAVVYFWQNEFPVLSGKPQSSILIRLDTFLRQKLIRNIVCQRNQILNFRQIMDSNKVLPFCTLSVEKSRVTILVFHAFDRAKNYI